jgi:hypothetical protein
VSFFNPAGLAGPSGAEGSSVASVSYDNPGSSLRSNTPQPQSLRAPTDAGAARSSVSSLSLANGPSATALTPLQLSRGAARTITLTIVGGSLTGANRVTIVGIGDQAILGSPRVSDDGKVLTVSVDVLPGAALGIYDVIVSGNGWSTPASPAVRVEIVP